MPSMAARGPYSRLRDALCFHDWFRRILDVGDITDLLVIVMNDYEGRNEDRIIRSPRIQITGDSRGWTGQVVGVENPRRRRPIRIAL